MINIVATISGHQLMLGNASYSTTQVTIPSGSSYVDAITTTFSGADWSNASTKKAAFWRKDTPEKVYNVDVASNSVMIPTEVIAKPGLIYVVFAGESASGGGSQRSSRIATNAAAIFVEQGYIPGK